MHKVICGMFDLAYKNGYAQSLIDELKYELHYLPHRDPREEYAQLDGWIAQLNCPEVFCHNDFRGSNILVTQLPDQPIVLTDHEYAAYGYRSHDLGFFIREWGYESHEFAAHGLPPDEIIQQLAQLYIEECDKISPGYSSKLANSPEIIVREIKLFNARFFIFLLSFFMKNQESYNSNSEFDSRENMVSIYINFSKYKFHSFLNQLCLLSFTEVLRLYLWQVPKD